MAKNSRRGNLEWISRLSDPSESSTTRSCLAMAFSTCACVACLNQKKSAALDILQPLKNSVLLGPYVLQGFF